MADTSICATLESQIDELLPLYDLAEEAMPFEQTRLLSGRPLNDDEHRKNMVFNWNYGATSRQVGTNGMYVGFMAVLIGTRPMSKNIFDLTTMYKCPVKTGGLFMLGCAMSSCMVVTQRVKWSGSAPNQCLNDRQIQNEKGASLLRTMKFHIATRQTGSLN